MGLKTIDIHTFFHFLFGILSSKAGINIFLSNFVHFLIEMNERTYNLNGKKVESTKNHVGDILAFFLGSSLSKDSVIKSMKKRNFVLFVVLAVALKEILREL